MLGEARGARGGQFDRAAPSLSPIGTSWSHDPSSSWSRITTIAQPGPREVHATSQSAPDWQKLVVPPTLSTRRNAAVGLSEGASDGAAVVGAGVGPTVGEDEGAGVGGGGGGTRAKTMLAWPVKDSAPHASPAPVFAQAVSSE